ncbi:MAG: nucleoside 2-deoxyribosyltransferase [Deltaproteobacteria bacterium]|nr:nucleoside 2-deoxyribosyltransferase [Deltaproteobacteria bacterium]
MHELTVVGGVYREECMKPSWSETFGSAGRAASALSSLGVLPTLYTYLDATKHDSFLDRAAFEKIKVKPTSIDGIIEFIYHHPLDTPVILNSIEMPVPELHVSADRVIRYGMIEHEATIHADYAVFDPQNVGSPRAFHANGSTANHLAVILNLEEGRTICKSPNAAPRDIAHKISKLEGAEVVIVKMGAKGALVLHDQDFDLIPAFQTKNVWKIGSGDVFVAHFAYHWMCLGASPNVAALSASKATAYYCETKGFPTSSILGQYAPTPVAPSCRFLDGYRPTVYLAGPFFSLGQLWIIEEARRHLMHFGLRVFSPYHDVGHGSAEDVVQRDIDGIDSCDLMFAIGDGMDPGTIFEVGYACSKGKPVIFYCENESAEDRKMMAGSGCIIQEDFVTSLYRTLWVSSEL